MKLCIKTEEPTRPVLAKVEGRADLPPPAPSPHHLPGPRQLVAGRWELEGRGAGGGASRGWRERSRASRSSTGGSGSPQDARPRVRPSRSVPLGTAPPPPRRSWAAAGRRHRRPRALHRPELRPPRSSSRPSTWQPAAAATSALSISALPSLQPRPFCR